MRSVFAMLAFCGRWIMKLTFLVENAMRLHRMQPLFEQQRAVGSFKRFGSCLRGLNVALTGWGCRRARFNNKRKHADWSIYNLLETLLIFAITSNTWMKENPIIWRRKNTPDTRDSYVCKIHIIIFQPDICLLWNYQHSADGHLMKPCSKMPLFILCCINIYLNVYLQTF